MGSIKIKFHEEIIRSYFFLYWKMAIGWKNFTSLLPFNLNAGGNSGEEEAPLSPYQQPLSDNLDELLKGNKQWARDVCSLNPGLFPRLAKTQTPRILWIGCSDSRVPETEIFKASPGDFFVHRNIANLVHENDASLNSVLQYAVDGLKVQHIIVCGHYCCGGVKAAMDPPDLNQVCDWIKPITKLYEGKQSILLFCLRLILTNISYIRA